MVEAATKLPCQAAIIDGEIIVQDENGISDFDACARQSTRQHRIAFFAFDLLHLVGQDLRRSPLMDRRAVLGGRGRMRGLEMGHYSVGKFQKTTEAEGVHRCSVRRPVKKDKTVETAPKVRHGAFRHT